MESKLVDEKIKQMVAAQKAKFALALAEARLAEVGKQLKALDNQNRKG